MCILGSTRNMTKFVQFIIFFICAWRCFVEASIIPKNHSSIGGPYVMSNIKLLHFEGKSYYLGTTFKTSFLQANLFCQMIGMQLVSIYSAAESNILYRYIMDTIGAGNNFWSSGSRLVDDKTWLWLTTGETMKYTNWVSTQPDNSNNDEKCIELAPERGGLYWNDLACYKSDFFICEKYDDKLPQEAASTKLSNKNEYQNGHIFQHPPVNSNIKLLHFEDKSYYLGTTFKTSFLQANLFCQMIGMQLVSIRSAAESNSLYRYIMDTIGAGNNFWSAGSRLGDDKTWLWLTTGETMKYTNWVPSQPDNSNNNERCIELAPERGGLYWNDLACEKSDFFICEKYDDKLPQETASARPTENESQNTINSSQQGNICSTVVDGKEYKVIKTKATQERASQTCKQYGMELVSIPDKKTNDVITNLISQQNTTVGFWTSGIKQCNGKWIFSDYKPLVYTNWAQYEPDSKSNAELCLHLHPSGKWNDLNCDRELFFICESRNPTTTSRCKSQITPSINIYINNKHVTDVTNGTVKQSKNIACSCEENDDEDDGRRFPIEPRFGDN